MQQGRRSDDGPTVWKCWESTWAPESRGCEQKGQARRKKCKVRFSLIKKNKPFRKSYMKVGVKKVAACGYGASKNVESPCSREPSTERFKLRRQMAAAAGKKRTTSSSLFMDAFGLEVEEELFTMATQYWAEGYGLENGQLNKQKLV